MAVWAARLTLDQVPLRTLRAARAQVLDMVAALHAAARTSGVRCVLDGARGFCASGRATVLATGERRGPADAALANAACSMAQDFDDIVWMGHTCHSAVFASLAVAEHEGRSTRELLLAVIVANEIGGRLGASSFLGPLNGQMWTFVHLIGAAAAAAKLLGLDARETAHAMAIALAQPTFPLQPGFLAPTSKLLAAATPTASGIGAAYFARAGMTGALRILEAPRGFWQRFSFVPMPHMLGALGERWVLDTLTLKTFPGCHYFQTALAAIASLRRRCGTLPLERVRTVRIETTLLACEVSRLATATSSEWTAVTVCFDLGQAAAVLLHAGELGPTQLDSDWLAAHRPALEQWRDRIRVVHAPRLTAKVASGAEALGFGRGALGSLTLRDLLRIRRRYAQEAGSSGLRLRDLASFLRGRSETGGPKTAGGDGVPLYFPSRVTIDLGGETPSERIDLPAGSLASAQFEDALARKVLSVLPAEALGAGLRLEAHELPDLVRRFSAPARATA